MKNQLAPVDLRSIPVDLIDVLNSRERNKSKFDEIVENIQAIGLKKPICVTPRLGSDGSQRYLLICGEGRLKAFRSLAEMTIPALVVVVTDDDAYLMSLTENIARRNYRPLELLAGIVKLRDQGHDKKAIAKKTGLSESYVRGILTLLESGEDRLVSAVECGSMPVRVALAIVGAGDDNNAIQAALQEAYESGALRGNMLVQARRVIERRQTLGRSLARSNPRKRRDVSSSSLVRAYQREVERQKQMVTKAGLAQRRLAFAVGALRQLLADQNFTTLLRAERIDSLPTFLAERIGIVGRSV